METTQQPLLRTSPDIPPPGGYGSSPPPGPPGGEVSDDATPTAPPQPSAPPLSSMDQIAGYTNIGFEAAGPYLPPPLPIQPEVPLTSSNALPPEIPTISEEAARAALIELASSQCCYGKTAAREMIFTNITATSAFHYQLETFTEGRKTAWEYEPYTGQPVDGPQNGPAPLPWNILAQPGQLFHDQDKHFEVPHTASVKPCHNCAGSGFNQCWQCLGSTRVRCLTCSGTGRRRVHRHHDNHDHGHHHHHHHHDYVPCHTCHSTGRRICGTCQGHDRIPCSVCLSRGQLKCYIKLTVSWKTHRADEVVERTALPDELIKTAEGVVVMEDQQLRVFPVTSFPESAVNAASASLVQRHGTAFPSEKILMQRHWVRVVPVAEASCSWNSKTFTYFVYGKDEQVYAPDYPQKCCWGCVIL